MQERLDALDLKRRSDADSDTKLAELILYVCSAGDQYCGATKLNKILYFADSFSFAKHGESITGTQYIKEKFGPIPIRLMPVRDKLEWSQSIAIQQIGTLSGVMKKIVPLREANLDVFKTRDIAMTDWVIRKLHGRDSDSVSRLTHTRPAWQIAGPGEVIPYAAILLSKNVVTDEDISEAQDLITQYNWTDV